ncbi:acyl-CoA dehydrogenase [Actinomadura sp. 7K507]|uniref:acyl-CoA dehydrogenase n=1 Tax=Actinomadura sp. 7K507 TaxID=2530365 RepID=UPI001048A492|nr:acyl-CoA dehydrogenase [Actinomadura sp. 7K507]TDC92990.1 acyl-CoA dehydrogenase [Actinomadura sp. 7K507]
MTSWTIHGADEHETALRASLVTLLDRRAVQPPASPTAATPDRRLWEEICGDFGLGEVAADEADGTYSPTRLMATCFELLGERLAPVPAFSTLGLAAPLVRACGGTQHVRSWWHELLAGRVVAAVAVPTDPVVVHDGATVTIRGTAPHTVDGAGADVLLVVAEVPGHGCCLLEVDPAEHERAPRRPEAALDLSRELGHITFLDAPARVIGRTDAGAELRGALATRSAVLLAAEQLGGLAACLRLAVEHAKTRFQFGRSIGSFQAIKHRLSDMYLGMELTRTAVMQACGAIDAGAADAELWAAIAHRTATENFTRGAAQALQIHGGLGFTWEHPIHLFVKRARSSEVLLDLPSERTTRIVELLGL